MDTTFSQNDDVNLGIYDGDVSHAEVNCAIGRAAKMVILGEQTRLPFFPNDQRVAKLHSGDPRVLQFWKVLHKIPSNVRNPLIMGPVSFTLTTTDSLLCFRDYRHHQTIHIGRRRRTIYLPEVILHQAEEKGYDYWAVAEGIIYAGWILLDFLLLAGVLKAFGEHGQDKPNMRMTEAYLGKFAHLRNTHRRLHPKKSKSEIVEFIEGYKSVLAQVKATDVTSENSFTIARELFDSDLAHFWARDKMERIADIFDYPKIFLFDRDIIHGAAFKVAERKGQDATPRSFADLLHDYRDAMRFDPNPLMTTFCKGIVPKPRAQFLEGLVDLGVEGLMDFFAAYREGVMEVLDLVHPLWMYLCRLSSDPAGVWVRVGRCRALARAGRTNDIERAVAGICIRLDRALSYRRLAAELMGLGETGREELQQVIGLHHLRDADEWATFRMKKQSIVSGACEVLNRLDAHDFGASELLAERRKIHEDELVRSVLEDNPHRHTSDPSGVLMHTRAYQRSLREFGAADPDTNFLLASLLIRLDRSENYPYFVSLFPRLGSPAVSALYEVLEQISQCDERRHDILQQARSMLGRILLDRQLRKRAQDRARELQIATVNGDGGGATLATLELPDEKPDEARFVSLRRDLGRKGNAFDKLTFETARANDGSSVAESTVHPVVAADLH